MIAQHVRAHAVCSALLEQAAEDNAIREAVLRAAVGIVVADAFAADPEEPGVELQASLRRLRDEVRASFDALRATVVALPVGGRRG